jgi:TonB family protein
VWSLGVTLVEVLTQHFPEPGFLRSDLPQPFAEIARHCLQPNPADRWTIPQISKYLAEPEAGVLPSRLAARKRRYVVPVGVLILLALVVITVAGVVIRRSDTETPPPAAPTVAAKTPDPQPQLAIKPEPGKPASAAKIKEEAPKPEPAKEPKPVAAAEPANDAAASVTGATGDQPLPDIPSHARNTIRGRVKVNVKVEVNPSGKVTDAKLEPPAGSKYFSELAMKAVRQWKFEPLQVNGSDAAQRWRVRFEFQKSGTKVQRQRLSP